MNSESKACQMMQLGCLQLIVLSPKFEHFCQTKTNSSLYEDLSQFPMVTCWVTTHLTNLYIFSVMMIQTHLYEWCKSQPSIFFIYHRYTIFLQCHIFCKLRFSIQMYCMNFEAVLRYASWNYLWRHQFCSFEKDNFIFFYFLIGTIIEMHSCTFTFVFCLAPFFFLKVSLSVSLSFVKFLFFCLFFFFLCLLPEAFGICWKSGLCCAKMWASL